MSINICFLGGPALRCGVQVKACAALAKDADLVLKGLEHRLAKSLIAWLGDVKIKPYPVANKIEE